jgi:hypothetical protein
MKSTRKRIKNDLRQIFKKNVDFMCGFPRFFLPGFFSAPGQFFPKRKSSGKKTELEAKTKKL